MIDIQNARVNTAGAYVCLHGLYLFAIGTRLQHGCIPVIRLGGHREENETGWQCAVREVHEEANLHIKPVIPADDLSPQILAYIQQPQLSQLLTRRFSRFQIPATRFI